MTAEFRHLRSWAHRLELQWSFQYRRPRLPCRANRRFVSSRWTILWRRLERLSCQNQWRMPYFQSLRIWQIWAYHLLVRKMNTNLSSHQHAQHATNKSYCMKSTRRLPNLPAETTTSVRLEACTVHGNLRVYSERSPLKGWTVPTRHQTRVWELPNICKSGRGFPIPIFDYRRVTTITPDKLWLVKPLFLGKVPINRFVETLTDCLGFITVFSVQNHPNPIYPHRC